MKKGYAHSLERFESILLASDLNIANLETPLTHPEASPLEGQKRCLHWSDVEHGPETFRKYNMNVFCLANNHSMDYGVEGLGQTLQVLGDKNMISFGAGLAAEEARQPFVHTFTVGHRTVTLAIIASFELRQSYEERYSFYATVERGGVNALSVPTIVRQIGELRATYPDALAVIFPHWGKNYRRKSPEQTELAHQLIDAGATLVIGHGGHVFQEGEQYKGRWIMYGIGNFMFNSPGRY